MRVEDFVIPKLFDSLGLASNPKLFGEAQVCVTSNTNLDYMAFGDRQFCPT